MIILDDFESSEKDLRSRVYESPSLYVEVNKVSDLPDFFDLLELEKANGKYIVLALAYELGYELLRVPSSKPVEFPLIQAWFYEEVKKYSKEDLDQLIAIRVDQLASDQKHPALYNFDKRISKQEYFRKIDQIKDLISDGVCYQINFTYPLVGNFMGHPLALYQSLRDKFPVNFGAYIDDGSTSILCFSPELFLSKLDQNLCAMPMKGTANALITSPFELSSDEKNRAENVMIVDLLRNDLSRIAKLGTVKVEDLFKVTRFGNVLQMTSKVKAQVADKTAFKEILNATFPCGSITGAPKKKSIEMIGLLESESRGIYCGGIGWLDPNGDFGLNVAIRTMTLDHQGGCGRFKFGVGSGITIDSNAQDEWIECEMKTNFLYGLRNEIQLFETLRVENAVAVRLKEHIDRLVFSALKLNYSFDFNEMMSIIQDSLSRINRNLTYRLKLTLNYEGVFEAHAYEIENDMPQSSSIFWAEDLIGDYQPIDPQSNWVKYKTTNRKIYDSVWLAAVKRGGFDGLLINKNGFVAEGGRSSVFIKPKNSDIWLTPPLDAGILPGVMRATLVNGLNDWKVEEKNIRKQDVIDAEKIILTNSLRGIVPVHLALIQSIEKRLN